MVRNTAKRAGNSPLQFERKGPLLDAIKHRLQRNQIPLNFPGHKMGRIPKNEFNTLLETYGLQLDYSDIKGLDRLNCPTGVLKESQKLAASIFGADHTFYLINGTTVGIHAAVLATCPEGSTIVMSRDCHMSAYNAAIMARCSPVYLVPEFVKEHGICVGITPEEVQRALETTKSPVGAVLLVSPTYFGSVSDVRSIASICHSFNVPLIVDEAHGGHFKFHESFPEDALTCGADIVIQSTHKVLTSMTQSSMLHLRSSLVSPGQISKHLCMLQSSSPSYVLMASLEAAAIRATSDMFTDPIEAAQMAFARLRRIDGLRTLHDQFQSIGVFAFDPLRLTINVSGLGISADDVYDRLEAEFGILPEITTDKLIVLAFGPGSKVEDAKNLVGAMQQISDMRRLGFKENGVSLISQIEIPQSQVMPHEAFCMSCKSVALKQSSNEVCAELIVPYPPGIPLIAPGEIITPSLVEILINLKEQGAYFDNVADSSLNTIKILE